LITVDEAPEIPTWAMLLAGSELLRVVAVRNGKREARLAV